MARPRTATNILERTGAFKVSPGRKKARVNEPKGKGHFPKAAPKHLSPNTKACWREIVRLVPDGVLTKSDVIIVEIVAELLAELRDDPRLMDTSRITRLSSEMHKIGLSPSARATLQIEPDKKSQFDEF